VAGCSYERGLTSAAGATEGGLFLASDEARYVTGVTFPVDAGFTLK
jgi:NAD(P)-dependent dehydrogenase (short-subunit alcohol dehydrogenase family)